jgi:predicted ATP-grasp superfamily ATP-dependent carboligase
LPEPLVREGDAMLRSLLCDLSEIAGIQVVTSRDRRLAAPTEVEVHDFEKGIEWADAVWPIAPETAGVLERVSREILQRGKMLIGSAPETVRIVASKTETAKVLAAAGIAVVPVVSSDDELQADAWVVKPDDGAGCVDTHLFRSRREAMDRAATLGYILQPYIPGEPRSLSLLCHEYGTRVVSCNRQLLRIEERHFRFLGCEVNIAAATDDVAQLALRIADALPGLFGYCGVDFVHSVNGPVVVEVNPRLTTSYVGLSRAIGENVARSVLELLR